MLQNRVDPFGNLIRTSARGSLMGNRGVLHNDMQELVRPFKLKAWLTCRLEFNERKREIMAPRRYTELFFLDEATSFAAGHRPCFECRRSDFNKFKSLWLKGNPEYNFDENTSIQKIDEVLHRERIDHNNSKITFEEDVDNIPDGSFVLFNNRAFLAANKLFFLWSPFGYDKGLELPVARKLTVLTSRSIVNTFGEGYLPQIAIATDNFNYQVSNYRYSPRQAAAIRGHWIIVFK